MKTSHEDNTSDDYAFQEIGMKSSGRESNAIFKSVAKRPGGALFTKGNKANHKAVQRLYAPDDPDTIVTYKGNVSDTSASQCIGMDVSMEFPPHQFKKSGRWRK